MPIAQTPLRELLKDPIYKAWAQKEPKTRPGNGEVWVVWYLPLNKPQWKAKRFHTWREAMTWIIPRLKRCQDAAICCTHQESKPPIIRVGYKTVKVKKVDPRTAVVTYESHKVPVRKYLSQIRTPEGHNWCGYCRRFTVFGYYRKHHALPRGLCTPYERRCRICGVRLSFLGRWSQ